MSDRFRNDVDLAQPRLGAAVVFATDDFFADKGRLISPEEPVFIVGKYDANGKWMDGWESRRKRGPGYDHCIVKLGRAGVISGFEIDTRHFTGNYPPAASVDACAVSETIPSPDAVWTPLTSILGLKGDDRQLVEIGDDRVWTHVRLNIFPDGGVARLRVFGRVHCDWSQLAISGEIDLLAMENGGRGLIANDEHYGRIANLTAPGRGANMGDGWETRRRREPGSDWAILELGHLGVVERILVDTAHFKGNYPDRCMIQAAGDAHGPPYAIAAQSLYWPVLLPEQKLQMDCEHVFTTEILSSDPIRFVRLNIIPDGGVSRLRMFGRLA